MPVVIPLHPRTKKKLQEYNIKLNGQVNSIDPVGYLDMVMLEKNSHKIVTDSGGVQKEAFFYKVPCVTLRVETEWVELVDLGVNVLVGSDQEKIKDMVKMEITSYTKKKMYGEGNTAENILRAIIKIYN